MLGRSADKLRSRVNRVRSHTKKHGIRQAIAAKVNELHTEHYFSWRRHICLKCKPANFSSLRSCCKNPSDFRSVKLNRNWVLLSEVGEAHPAHFLYHDSKDFRFAYEGDAEKVF